MLLYICIRLKWDVVHHFMQHQYNHYYIISIIAINNFSLVYKNLINHNLLGKKVTCLANMIPSEHIKERRTERIHVSNKPQRPVNIEPQLSFGNPSKHSFCTVLQNRQ